MGKGTFGKYGIIWDLDGVLVDSGPFHYQAWKEVLARRGIEFTETMFRQVFGRNNQSTLEVVLGRQPSPEETEQIVREKEAAFRKLSSGKTPLLPGVRRLLEDFKQRGCRQAIGSSAPAGNISQVVEELRIRPFFDAIVSGSSYPSKPHPGIFEAAARQIAITPACCLVIEDSTAGIEAAHKAGMLCLAVATTNPLPDLDQADLAVNLLDEADASTLLSMLQKRGGENG